MDNCPICDAGGKKLGGRIFECQYCGDFRWQTHKKIDDEQIRTKLLGWMSEQNRNAPINPLVINNRILDWIMASSMPTVMQRADYILLEMEKIAPQIGEEFRTHENNNRLKLLRSSYSSKNNELKYILNEILFEKHYIHILTGKIKGDESTVIQILPEGHIRLEELRKKQGGKNAFVAMWFGDAMNDAYENGIKKGIEDAGYNPLPINKKDHNNKIDDEIMVEIKSAAFVVADFTGHRGGVYFEAGYALGLALPVIWTCRDAHLQDLHFDIRQYNFLTWKDAKLDEADKKPPKKDRKPYEAGDELDVFAKKLENRIINTVGKAPL